MKARIFPSFLIVFFALVFNAQAAEATALATDDDYTLEGKTLYINKKMEYLTGPILDAFKKYWVITSIKYEDEEDIVENFKDPNALILTVLTSTYVYDTTKTIAVAFGGSNSSPTSKDFKYRTFDKPSFVQKIGNNKLVESRSEFNLDMSAIYLVKQLQYDAYNYFKPLDNKAYKGKQAYLRITPEKLKTENIYLVEGKYTKKFNPNKFCNKTGIEIDKIKTITEAQFLEKINADEDFYFFENADIYYQSIYSSKTGKCVAVFSTNNGPIMGIAYTSIIILGFVLLFTL